MPNRRSKDRSAFGAITMWAGEMISRRPVDAFAILGAVAASLIIVVNAVYLQSGATPSSTRAIAESRPRPAEAPKPIEQAAIPPLPAAAHTAQPAMPHHPDPIAELIGATGHIPAPR